MTKVVGIVGWKDVGKTFFVTEIINLLVKKGYKVGAIKHAHHDFDIDKPGTCLLYTSPSPRDVEESRMPSSA